jgi:uncharacterized protein YerC
MAKYVVKPIDSECWEWHGTTDKGGYGRFKKDGKQTRAHRAAHELYIGPIPEGMRVCHTCDNPPCTNPDHLFLGTDLDNKTDSVNKKRHAHGEKQGACKLTSEQVLAILEDPRSYIEIANAYAVAYITICRIRRGRGWRHITEGLIPPKQRKPTYGRAKLQSSDIHAIRKDPRTCKDIAKDYGVDITAISRIKLGKTYKHIPYAPVCLYAVIALWAAGFGFGADPIAISSSCVATFCRAVFCAPATI